MSTYCVYHLIQVRTLHRHFSKLPAKSKPLVTVGAQPIPQLLIEDVPECEEVTEELLERAGYLFHEFNIPWANHVLEQVDAKTSPSNLVARIREGGFGRVTYADLVEQANEPL